MDPEGDEFGRWEEALGRQTGEIAQVYVGSEVSYLTFQDHEYQARKGDGTTVQASLIERPRGDQSVATGTARNDRGKRKKSVNERTTVVTSTVSTEYEAPIGSASLDVDHCPRRAPDGKCNGLYYGFLCIKEKCQMPNREAACEFCIGGDYCLKYNRFGCVGPENCGTKDDYLSYIRKAREKAEAYQ